MGVIKKVLYRGNILGRPRHRNIFLDMEENIHIHYRDLRIELSRGEFEDFARAFRKQSDELLKIIDEKNYQDGKLPNANQEDVRIWTESRLKSEVKYHPQRLSLEECGDGYHFHYRNYKLLIDPAEFRQIVQLFKALDVDAPFAATHEEVHALLEANDVDFMLADGNVPGEILSISVAKYHVPKIKELFGYIGFSQEIQGAGYVFRGQKISVHCKLENQLNTLDYRRIRGNRDIHQLADYFSSHVLDLDPDDLNQIKCQVVDMYFAMSSGQSLAIDADPQTWLYAPTSKKIIFPYNPSGTVSQKDAEPMYRAWSNLLNRCQLGFVKPAKILFAKDRQKMLQQRLAGFLEETVAIVPAVEKIYLMGSALRAEMGRYKVPFMHGKLAKLGSDVDILIEIDPAREAEIPESWRLINNNSSNRCAIYHIGQIPLEDGAGEWPRLYPHIEFIHHLIDAYVFFPTRGGMEEKNAFLDKFKARLVYDRSRQSASASDAEGGRIAGRISQLYSFGDVSVEKMTVTTLNALYRILLGNQVYVLKLFKVAGNYSHNRISEHVDYEARLISQLRDRGVRTAAVIPTSLGEIGEVEGFPALLFEHLAGTVCSRPEYPIDKAAAALARIHRVQMQSPLDLEKSFSFEDFTSMWLIAFCDYAGRESNSPEIAELFSRLTPIYKEKFERQEDIGSLMSRSPGVHNHGDVKPKNLMMDETGEVCFFDFNNAFYGPRMLDILDGAFEFSLAEKYIHLADFSRFDTFIDQYDIHNPFSGTERADMSRWVDFMGIIKFTKEVRVMIDGDADGLRKRRAMAIAGFVLSRHGDSNRLSMSG
jgi:aminoglycoside phosphotransferase (APT) family kinase protein